MRHRFWLWTGSILAALLMITLSVWGYRENQMRKEVTIHAENHYQQSYHELTYYVDSLEESLGTALAMHTREAMRPQLVETWRLSTLAHASANELPLTLMPFNRTNEFLSHVGDFTYNTGVKTVNDRNLSAGDYKTLQKLYKESMTISEGLRALQEKVMGNHLRWMDVEWALKSKKQNQDNQVIDGLKQVDGQAMDYTQSFSPENPQNLIFQKKNYRTLKGTKLNKEQAIEALKRWLVLQNATVRTAGRTGKGSNIPAYTITLLGNKGKGPAYSAAISEKGGYVLWFIVDRKIAEKKIGMYTAQKKSADFLKKHNFRQLELTKRDQYNRVAVFTYVLKKKQVRCYPASIKVKVALDTNEVIAFDQSDYLANKCEVPLRPKLTQAAVRKQLNPDLHIEEVNLAVFQNTALKNVLCYEFFATKGQNTYRIFLNAANGDQEKVELVRD
ncbi:MAG: germination protein YpeB [Sporolactobacillus sp.]